MWRAHNGLQDIVALLSVLQSQHDFCEVILTLWIKQMIQNRFALCSGGSVRSVELVPGSQESVRDPLGFNLVRS